jgi:hypothetical protein
MCVSCGRMRMAGLQRMRQQSTVLGMWGASQLGYNVSLEHL